MREHADIRRRLTLTVVGFGALAVATCLLAPTVGSTPVSLSRVFDRSLPFDGNVDAQIFFLARLPRVADAGRLSGGVQLMHNGLRVVEGSYYRWRGTRMFAATGGVHEPQEERVFAEVLKFEIGRAHV